MNTYTLASIILSLAVLIAYINHRYVRVQSTIAIMAGAMIISLIMMILQHTGLTNVAAQTEKLLLRTDFHSLLLNGMLGFLLFAGALTVNLSSLKSQKWEVGILASLSTIASTILVGYITFYLLPFVGLHLPLLYCFLFGAVISPTDPIAVLATFKEIGAPKRLEVCVAGESLFNDGVAIVIFLTLYQLTFKGQAITLGNVSFLFLTQAVGGLAYGAVLGFITHVLIRHCRDRNIAILVTVAAVTGGYNLALGLHISGALAIVVAGIFVGNTTLASSNKKLAQELQDFWEIIDEILNAILFLLIGFELLTIKADYWVIVAALGAIPLILFIRLITVSVPMKFIQLRKSKQPLMIAILTWGGLRGGLAVALALSIPNSPQRDIILAMTYAVVAFAVIVQGLTIKPLANLANRLEQKETT